jgi:hypothetical protein
LIYVADREADLYESFAEAHPATWSLPRRNGERSILWRGANRPTEKPPSLEERVRMVAGFGGFLNRKDDGYPGPQTI